MKTAIAYAGLKNIDKVVPRSSEDEPCFRELKSVLQKHGKLSRFGICLLHEHFPVYENERLVEECDATTRVLTIQPAEVGSDKFGETIETSWRLDVESDISRPTGNCIAYCKEIDGPNGKTHHASHKATP
jgi:hypothetical protein